jgi:hypothetical protein
MDKKSSKDSDAAKSGMQLASNPNAGLGPTKPNTNTPIKNKK